MAFSRVALCASFILSTLHSLLNHMSNIHLQGQPIVQLSPTCLSKTRHSTGVIEGRLRELRTQELFEQCSTAEWRVCDVRTGHSI